MIYPGRKSAILDTFFGIIKDFAGFSCYPLFLTSTMIITPIATQEAENKSLAS